MKHLKRFNESQENNIIEFKGNYYMFNDDELKQNDNYINTSELSRGVGTVFYIDKDKNQLGSNEFTINTLSKCKKIIASDNSNLKGVEYKDTSWFKNK